MNSFFNVRFFWEVFVTLLVMTDPQLLTGIPAARRRRSFAAAGVELRWTQDRRPVAVQGSCGAWYSVIIGARPGRTPGQGGAERPRARPRGSSAGAGRRDQAVRRERAGLSRPV